MPAPPAFNSPEFASDEVRYNWEREQGKTSTQVKRTKFARLCRASRQGVFCHVLYGVLHTHSTFRDEDSLSDKGNLCDYVDRAYF